MAWTRKLEEIEPKFLACEQAVQPSGLYHPKKGPRKEKLIYRQPGRKIQKWQSLLLHCKFLISKGYVNTLTINTYSR